MTIIFAVIAMHALAIVSFGSTAKSLGRDALSFLMTLSFFVMITIYAMNT